MITFVIPLPWLVNIFKIWLQLANGDVIKLLEKKGLIQWL